MTYLPHVPDILRQRLVEAKESAKFFYPKPRTTNNTPNVLQVPPPPAYENGKILLWRGLPTKYFWMAGLPAGSIMIYKYQSGTKHASPHLEYNFGRTAVVTEAIFFPLAEDCPGVVVAVSDRSMDKHGDYLAYLSLNTRRLLRCVYVNHPVTSLCAVLDGTAQPTDFQRLNNSFHDEWPHILLVGCRFGYVSLVHMDITAEDDIKTEENGYLDENSLQARPEPIRAKKNVHLSKIFYDDQMFAFRSDDNHTKCNPKEKVCISALHYIEKSGLVVIGFNFGGIMVVSLRSSKVYSLFYLDGSIDGFALQEPEEDPRPILFMWILVNTPNRGPLTVLLSINFPKDEERTKNPEEYTYLEPVFMPSMKFNPEPCTQMITMQTIRFPKKQAQQQSNGGSLLSTNDKSLNSSTSTSYDTSLMFMAWLEQRKSESRIHGALFDLNAYYAKRLIGKVVPDSTIARQLPFFARFSTPVDSLCVRPHTFLDLVPEFVNRFAPPAFLKETIDQLYYPSTYYLTVTCLTKTNIFEANVQPIQTQLIVNLTENIQKYFEAPHDPATWIHAIGLANSLPSPNINEERACLLRVMVNNYFPGILILIDAVGDKPDSLKFIQKWVWKEIEITKDKFDELCSPLFAPTPMELSPSARGFIHHARVFFKRAAIIFDALIQKVGQLNDPDWSKSIDVQFKVARQLRLFSAAIGFASVYNLLPVNNRNSGLFTAVAEEFRRRFEKVRSNGKRMQIHALVDEMIELNPRDLIWQRKRAEQWYPPTDFANFLPILLLVNITEHAKLALIGYYCLDLEIAVKSRANGRPRDEFDDDLFSKCCSFLMQEDFSLDVMKKIQKYWYDDKQLSDTDWKTQLLLNSQPSTLETEASKEKELKWLPLTTPGEVRHCQEEYLKLEWGLYKYNLNIIEKRRFKLLLETPPLKGDEPEFVTRCHAKCLEIRQKYPGLFKKVEPYPQYIIDRFIESCKLEAKQTDTFMGGLSKTEDAFQQQMVLQLSVQPSDGLKAGTSSRTSMMPPISALPAPSFRPSLLGKRSLALISADVPRLSPLSKTSANDTMPYEELPLTIATPRKRQRLMLFSESTAQTPTPGSAPRISQFEVAEEQLDKSPVASKIDRNTVKTKDWERINRVMQTPISLRKSISRIPIRQRAQIHGEEETEEQQMATEDGGEADSPKRRSPTGPEIGAITFADEEDFPPTPEQELPPAPPTSILKSDKRPSRLPSKAFSTGKPRLRFASSLFTAESIPSRAERAFDERHDTSYSSFAVLSESSASSASTLLNSLSQQGSSLSAPPSTAVDRSTTNSESSSQRSIQGVPILEFEENQPQATMAIITEEVPPVDEPEVSASTDQPTSIPIPVIVEHLSPTKQAEGERITEATADISFEVEDEETGAEDYTNAETVFITDKDTQAIMAVIVEQPEQEDEAMEDQEAEGGSVSREGSESPISSADWVRKNLRRSVRLQRSPPPPAEQPSKAKTPPRATKSPTPQSTKTPPRATKSPTPQRTKTPPRATTPQKTRTPLREPKTPPPKAKTPPREPKTPPSKVKTPLREPKAKSPPPHKGKTLPIEAPPTRMTPPRAAKSKTHQTDQQPSQE